jgi:tetratricopeptide (TPR) repeat protein
MATAPPPAQRWLFGPVPDLLLGCGAAYVALFGVFVAAGGWWAGAAPAWLAPLCVLALSLPHYGATLVRVYEHASDRRAYALFTVWVTLALVAAFVAGVYSPGVGSILLTLYLSWSPWHYTGQNYGLAVMFLRRRGFASGGVAKRWVYASFALSFALTLCVMHESSSWADTRVLPQTGPALHFVALGLPGAGWLVPGVALAWAAATAVALAWMFRRAGAEALPAALLVVTQSLWFALPAAALHWRLFPGIAPLDPASVAVFLVWIAVGHAVQYLWVTAYYARASNDWRGLLPWLGKALAAGALVWTLPVALFAADPLGAPSYETGLAFLVASVVNLHHFVLDGAIWKLRHHRIARVLIASAAAEPEERGGGRLRSFVWALAAASLVVAVLAFSLESFLLPRALARDPARAAALLDALALIGRDASQPRAQVAAALMERGRNTEALVHYRRSADLVPAASTFANLALVHARLGDTGESRLAQDRALALAPDDALLLEFVARLSERQGDAGRARALRERAAAIPPAGAVPSGARGRAAIY